MTPQPLFSLLVPNYNNARYLPALVTSVIRQTYANWELIFVDDASQDDSVAVMETWRSEKRIKVIRFPVNRGAGAAFGAAAATASGEILGMLGADDALQEDALDAMVDAHRSLPDASLINSDLVVCGDDLRPAGRQSSFGPLPAGGTLIRNCCVSNFATFKRNAYLHTSGFDSSFLRAVDHDIYLKLEEVGSLGYVPEPLYLYRTHRKGISQGDNGMRAAQSALRARGNAYVRRLGTSLPNLTTSEYRDMMSVYHRREAQVAGGGRFESLRELARAARFRPGLASSAAFWGSAARSLLKTAG